jgi:hypothetical protein
MTSSKESVEVAIERVLGDRQRHEAWIMAKPGADRHSFNPISRDPKLRIYVASAHGCYAFCDDRDQLTCSARERIDVVEAEYLERTPEALLKLPLTTNPRVISQSECKGEMLFRLGQDNRTRPAVDYVAFLDDDIEVSASVLLQGATAAAQRNCPVFQLQLSHDSHAVWPLLKQRHGSDAPIGAGFPEMWTDIDFVEIMAPVVAQTELDRGLLEVLAPFKSGFGWDFYLLPVLAELYDDFRPGLFRGGSMRHIRPVQTRGDTLFSHGLSALQEEELLRAGLLQCLFKDGPLPDRAIFLRQLYDVLTTNTQKHQAIAGALASTTERHWRSRGLESQWHQLLQQHRDQQHALEESRRQIDSTRQQLEDAHRQQEGLILMHRDEQEALQQLVHHLQQQKLEVEKTLERCELEVTSYSRYIANIRRSYTWRIGRMVLSPVLWPKRLIQALCSRLGCYQYPMSKH